MYVSWLYYLTTFAILMTLTVAGDCNDIKNLAKQFLEIEDDDFINEVINTCVENEQGKVIEL